ncbi:putative glucose-6-phosphate 1-epimerase [Chenopodium quinoa]|uniref:glucose-6-phosphate 1-epimerase n=1 Tax=Chenopodium quinoa TaxID=63459 RepID=A0A803LWE4_CHEQI|nr:putative glucose-6-phosphate 1-epimerase [Chenopodium quinoa]
MVLSLLVVEKNKMTNCEEISLDSRPPSYEEIKDKNGITQIILRNLRGDTVRISLYGGQVLSWKNEQGDELLFMSSKATFKPPNAVRGGIPICFPQFGSRGLLEQHGFARNRMWVIDDQPPSPRTNKSKGYATVNLLLKPSDEDLKVWPNKFEIRVRVTLSEDGNLVLRSRVKNANGKPLSFNIAFRTYFAISDISEVRVEGLETLDYLDCLQDRQRFTEQGDALTFESEVDRIYLSSSDVVALFDHGSKRTFQIRKQGLPDVAVWNPWEKKAKALTDLGDDEYKKMLCVDGSAIEKPITLKPGEEWNGQLEFTVLSSC